MNDFSGRFYDMWLRSSGGTAPDPLVWRTLEARYNEPHRHYHNLGHLRQCLGELDQAGKHIAEANATEMAIWFHDVIYNYAAKDNEERSADTFRDFAKGVFTDAFIDRVYDFILATKHVGAALDEGTALVVDIDLSGFGLPWDAYLADCNALRREAPNVTDERYYAGKLRFLDELLSWNSLFQTDYFRDRLEETARDNIRRYSAQLRSQGFGVA